jgi:hypothetical protein
MTAIVPKPLPQPEKSPMSMKALALVAFGAGLIGLAIALALPAGAAPAGERQGIDFTQVLAGANGEVLTQGAKDCKPGQLPGKDCPLEPQTLGDVALVALLAMIDEDRNLDPRKKWERDQLARKVFGNRQAALSPEEIALIKDRIGKVYGPAQVGAAWPLLDPTLR